MSNIMSNYNTFVKDLMDQYEKYKNYMIFFFGDHGQKESGSHGDDSLEEVFHYNHMIFATTYSVIQFLYYQQYQDT